jgi:AI-2 transport protein TqsA
MFIFMIKELKVIKTLLMVIVVTIVFFLLKALHFIFVPLVGALFLALLFMPMMRWLYRHHVNKYISVAIAVVLVAIMLKVGWEVIRISGQEIMQQKTEVIQRIEAKIDIYLYIAEGFLGFENQELHHLIGGSDVSQFLIDYSAKMLEFLKNTVSMLLMTVFFLVLLLIDTLNIPKIMESTLFNTRYSSVKTFMQIEKSIVKFMEVKFLMSLFTGIGFSVACYFFDVSFPIFWGLFTFAINYIQMIGSFVSTTLLALFAMAEIEPTGTLVAFIAILIGVQVVFGAIMEPILMGKSFSINTITILVMLMFWGFMWGIPGMILSIPITVLLKIILRQFKETKIVSDLMS